MTFYVYILFSETANKYYVGHSPNPQKRLTEHNSYNNKTKFTAKYQPWELMLFFPVSEARGEAIKVERFIKKQKSRKFIEELIFNRNSHEYFERLIKKVNG
jgi:putative endonuclease